MSENIIAKNKLVEFQSNLEKYSDQFKKVLPKHIDVNRFVKIAYSAVRKNQSLLSFSRESLLNACMDAAEDGLIPDGYESAFIVRKDRICYEPMYQGLLKLAYQTGHIKSIRAIVVYDNDQFRYWVDNDGEHIEYEPCFRGDRGTPYLTFAQAILMEGGHCIEVMPEKEMHAIRKMSSAKYGPWSGDFADEMRKKSAIKRLCKRLPQPYKDREFFDDEYEERYSENSLKIDTEQKPSRALQIMRAVQDTESSDTQLLEDNQEEVNNEE